MKHFIALLCLCFTTLSFAQKNNSPYLFVNTTKAHIPLKRSETQVQIAGTIAHVEVIQVYQNKGDVPVEATYLFPLATQAAVHDMHMCIGDRTITAQIFEKKKAQRVYKAAVAQGKRAAKLDQERPNVFQMQVGNIMPGDLITISVSYTEMLVATNGTYQFVAPAVVGPRYTAENDNTTTVFHTPYTAQANPATFEYDLKLTLNAGMIIKDIHSSSHHINTNYLDNKTAAVFLSKSNTNPGHKDFILNYSLRGHHVQSGLLLYAHEDENFFALQMEPKASIQPKDIPAREYLFIVDVSGSMNGYPLEVSKTLMRNLLCNLNPTDTFNVQLFASSSTVFSPYPVTASHDAIEAAIRFLSDGQGGGGTELLEALRYAYKLPRTDPSSARSMVVITDGYVNVEKAAFQLIENNLDQANVFTFGIGSSVNRYLIEGMAKVGHSQSFIATSNTEALTVAENFKTYISSPLLTQLKLKTKGFEIYDVAPHSIPDVFADRPITIYGKYRGQPEGRITLTGYHGKKRFKQDFEVTSQHLSPKHKALRYLWARKKIAQLDDYNTLFTDATKAEVTALGLAYNLATKHTSFVAVDETVTNASGKLKTVTQPLPMPQHVSNSAVGAAVNVTAQTTFKPSYSINFSTPLLKTEKRNITMTFKALYTPLVTKYLKQYDSMRFAFNTNGAIVRVYVLKNNNWVVAPHILKAFSKIKTNTPTVHKPFVLTLKK